MWSVQTAGDSQQDRVAAGADPSGANGPNPPKHRTKQRETPRNVDDLDVLRKALVPTSVLVTTSKALVTSVALVSTSKALVTSVALVSTSKALVPNSFLLLLVRHLLLAWHLFLLVRHLFLIASCYY